MSIRYEIDPSYPPGTVIASDDESGARYVTWDPEKAKIASSKRPLDGSDSSVVQSSGGPPPPPPTEPGQVAPLAAAPAPIVAPPPVEMPFESEEPMAPRPPPPRASMAYPGAPPAPAGTVITKAELTPGTPAAPYDKAAEERRHNALLDRNLELDSRRNAEQMVRTEQGLELNKQRLEDEKAQRVEAEKASRYATELDQVVRKEINPGRIMEGIGPSLMGLVGMAVAGFSKNPGLAMSRMNAALDRRIDQDVKLQTEQKDSMVNHLTKQLGSAQQAELHYKASVRGLALDRLQSQLDSMGVGNKYADLIQAGRDDVETIDDAAKAASYGKPATAKYEFGQPKLVKGAGGPKTELNNPTTQELKGLGITPDAWTKGLAGKISAGENSPTIAQAVTTTRQIDADIATMDALAAANGGTLPTKGVINVPPALVGVLSQMGYKPGQSAEEVGQLLNSYVNQQARSYGGAITESDRESAEKETGKSTQGVKRYLERLRKKNTDAVAAGLSQQFPGVGQKALNVLLKDQSNNTGVPKSTLVPFEVHNGPAAQTSAPEGPPAAPKNIAPDESAETARKRRKALVGAFDMTQPNPNYTGME